MVSWILRLNARRYRRMVMAAAMTLGISAGLLAIAVFVRLQADHAVRGDTRVVLNQAVQQLLRALESRRGTLTLLRDTLDNVPQLHPTEQEAMAKSAVAHTRHLRGLGLLRAGHPPRWWVHPDLSSPRARASLHQAVIERTRLRNIWRVSSTFPVFLSGSNRPMLVMFEPLRATAYRPGVIVGVFDLRACLADFFELTLQQPYPVQLLTAHQRQVLYRSGRWQPPPAGGPQRILEQPIKLDAAQWLLQIQPGITQTVKTISWLNILLVGVSVLAGLVAVGLTWLVAMRTWILQRAVSRRTAALRRTTDRLRQLATTDELTGLYNRRFFLERWQWEYERAKRYDRPLACLMIDVNGFKRVNDALGHSMGDLVLKQVSQELTTLLRQSDILARFGGDEFIVALPETSFAQASAVAEKLRQIPITGPWSKDDGVGPVRLSVGVGRLAPYESAEQVIQEADESLYASRHLAPSARA